MSAYHLRIACLLLILPFGLQADMEDMKEAGTTDHAALSFGDGYQLTLRMDPDHATVGSMATLQGALTRHGQVVKEVHVDLSFHHIEDDVDNYATAFIAPEGRFTLRHHFFDGAPHKIVLKVAPLEGGVWLAQELAMNIKVVAVQPPTNVVRRTLLLLLAEVAVFMVLRFAGGRWSWGRGVK